MAREFRVKTRLEAEDRSSGVIDRVQSKYRSFGQFLASRFVISFGDVERVVRGALGAIGSFTDAAAESENATRALEAALAPLGSQGKALAASLLEQAAALQKVTTAGDEEIAQGQALLASFTKNEAAIKAGTVAALDLAAGIGIDLRSAFLLVGKAAEGNTTALSRYGLTIDENLARSEKFAAALGQIEERFGGRAQAAAETYSGLIEVIGNAWGETIETLGRAITENDNVRASLERVRDVLESEQFTEGTRQIAESIAGVTSALLDAVAGFPAYLEQLRQASEQNSIFLGAQREFSESFDQVQAVLSAANDALGTLFNALGLNVTAAKAQAGAARESAEATEDQVEAFASAVATAQGHTAALAQNTAAQTANAAASERTARILREEAELRKLLSEGAQEFGVSLEDNAAKIERNNSLLLQADDAERRGLITRAKLAELTARVAEENAKLAGTWVEVAEGAAAHNAELASSTELYPNASSGARALAGDVDALGRSYASAAAQAQFFNAVAGVASRDARNQSEVDAALAAGIAPTLGGTRIRLPGGGSRLVGRRSFD